MKYKLVNCKITNDTNGNAFLKTTAVSDENADNGFSLPFFNPGFISNARYCIENGLSVDAYMTDYLAKGGAVIEKRTAKLDQVYFRRASDPDGKPTNEPAKDKATDAGRPVREYWKGWSLIERRDQILSTFFMLAPAEYQTIAQPQQQAPQQQQAQPQQAQQAAPENTQQQQQQFAQMPDPLE